MFSFQEMYSVWFDVGSISGQSMNVLGSKGVAKQLVRLLVFHNVMSSHYFFSYSGAGVRFIEGKGKLVYGISIVVLYLCGLVLV